MQFSNTLKTTLLLGALTGLLMLIGSALGGTGGMIIAFVFAIALNMGAWWFSDKIALAMSRAKEVTPIEAPDLHAMVDTLVQRANMPKPRVYVIDSEMPNAFATGRDPQHAAVAVTSGIMSILNRDELMGVIAHELAHIKHRDTLISSVAATIGGAITMLADMAMWALLFGGFGGSSDDDDDGAAGAVGGIFMIFLAPIAAVIIQLAISRSREFGADQGGAEIMGNPLPLAAALEKLEAWSHQRMQLAAAGHTPIERTNPSTAHLYIIPPVGGALMNLFRTHPQTSERVNRLRQMGFEGVSSRRTVTI